MEAKAANPYPVPGRRWDQVATWVTCGCCIVFIAWMGIGFDALSSPANYRGQKVDYYSLLVHGFEKGHLYMDVAADPRLASKDKAVVSQASFPLDASYFNGHIYLYFGVVPAALFLLPYAWLTGGDLEPRFLVVIFAVVGVLFSVATLRMGARDFFPRLRSWFYVPAVAALALATAVPSLLTRAMFYELAIAGGYAFTTAGLFWLYRALFAKRHWERSLACASLSFGLAVGCRPDLMFNLPVLAAAAMLSAWRAWKGAQPHSFLRGGAAAILPAAIIGLLLGLYNYKRFGHWGEFGVTYSMNYFMRSDSPLFSIKYLWPNLHWYYLTPPSLSPYFPYVFPEAAYFGPAGYRWGEVIDGQFCVTLLGAFVILLAWFTRKALKARGLYAFLLLALWMFVAPLIAVSLIGFRGNRYMVDCQPALILGVVLLAGCLYGLPARKGRTRMIVTGFTFLAGLAVAVNVMGGLQEFDTFKNVRPSSYRPLERWGNYPACWMESLGVLPTGPIELQVVFPTNPKESVIEPLIVAGTPEYTDALYVIERPGGQLIEFKGDHSGYGGPGSDPITITPGKTYSIGLSMGSLYPPIGSPFLATTREARTIRSLKDSIRVTLDGKTVLDRKMNSYDAPPWALEFGRNDITMNPARGEFSGRIIARRRLPTPQYADVLQTGVIRVRCEFPLDHPNFVFALVSSGTAGAGTLLYLSVLPENRVRFGVDEWSIGGEISDPLPFSPGTDHLLEIFIGPLARSAVWATEWRLPAATLRSLDRSISVWVDGRLVWNARVKNALDPLDGTFALGTNRLGFSTAQSDYPGTITTVASTPGDIHEFLQRIIGSAPTPPRAP